MLDHVVFMNYTSDVFRILKIVNTGILLHIKSETFDA